MYRYIMYRSNSINIALGGKKSGGGCWWSAYRKPHTRCAKLRQKPQNNSALSWKTRAFLHANYTIQNICICRHTQHQTQTHALILSTSRHTIQCAQSVNCITLHTRLLVWARQSIKDFPWRPRFLCTLTLFLIHFGGSARAQQLHTFIHILTYSRHHANTYTRTCGTYAWFMLNVRRAPATNQPMRATHRTMRSYYLGSESMGAWLDAILAHAERA